MEPTTVRERVMVIDVLRGFALIGIIVANMRGFNSPMEAYSQPYLLWNSRTDLVVQGLIDFFVTSKFMTLFAMLFGLGFAVQMERGGEQFEGVYLRRMIGLLAIGAIHAFLIWWGDILITYAAMGFCLLVFQRTSSDDLFRWSMMLYWLPMLMAGGALVLSSGGAAAAPGADQAMRHAIEVYRHGTFHELLSQRWQDWKDFNSSGPFAAPRVLGLFLFGTWVWRKGILRHVEDYLPSIRRTWRWSVPIGLAGNAATVAIDNIWRPNPLTLTPLSVAVMLIMSVAVPAMSLAYACTIVLLFRRPAWKRLLRPFAAVGRMALTNYLGQSVICTAIFYSFGLAWFGTMAPLAGLGLSLAIYAAQVVFSAAWTRAFRFGPAEWAWRSVTYARLQPMRTPQPR